MSRPLRIEYPGAVYHVTARGNRRAQIFTDDEDRNAFFNILAEVNQRFEVLCHAYCLMGNHYHLLLETPRGNLSPAMRQLNGVYTQTFNRLHRKCGHLLQGRYKAMLVQRDAYFLEVARYVVLNPVRAGLVKYPGEWAWSSYKATLGEADAGAWLTTERVLGEFGGPSCASRVKYREFVVDDMGNRWGGEVVGGVVCGSGEYAAQCVARVVGENSSEEIPKLQRFAGRPGLGEVLAGSGERAERVRRAVEVYGYTQKSIAVCLGVHYSAVSKLLSRKRQCTPSGEDKGDL